MVGIAAGLATCGKIVFVNSFAMFTAGRAFEQIRNSLAYPHLNVKVIGTHAGVTVGKDGATHQCLEDLAIMRSIPGMVVLSPCDANETRLMTKAMAEYNGPCFMRLGRLDVEQCTNLLPNYEFRWGKASRLHEGSDVTIIATGLMVQEALKARELLAQEGISAAVLDMHTIKPLDEEAVLKAAEETGCIVTGGGQYSRRTWRRCGRGCQRALSGAGDPCGREGYFRPQRRSLCPAGALRTDG